MHENVAFTFLELYVSWYLTSHCLLFQTPDLGGLGKLQQ
jgi:hypothetical protein